MVLTACDTDLQRGIRVECVPTGVKHLHHAARHFDIGVYFEANGHGTVLFSEECMSRIRAREAQTQDSLSATRQILAFSELINQTVGDALSDMLMVEAILALRQWGASEWDMAYEDLPNRLLKVEVPDRNIFLTTDAERKLTSPPGLQKSIDDEVNKYEGGRGFVRPSGTEDCVRVYAEATSPHHADGESVFRFMIDADVSSSRQTNCISRSTCQWIGLGRDHSVPTVYLFTVPSHQFPYDNECIVSHLIC
jgi:phosphoacetylglucosamine mutase